MIDLSSPEPQDADSARCYVIHEQDVMISSQADWQFPELPAKWLRQHPDYHFLGFLSGQPCYVCELSRHEFDDGQLQRVPLRRLIGTTFSDAEFSMASRALQLSLIHI